MIKNIVIVFMVLLWSGLVMAQDIPDITDLNIDGTIADSTNALNELPEQINPEVLPAETATQFFGYIKWIFANSDELVGATLAPILNSLYLLVFTGFTFVTIWLTIRVLVLGWRITLFIIEWVIKILELIPFFQ